MPPPDPTQAIASQPLPKPVKMISAPGVMRDGTRLSNKMYDECVWTRFYQDLPRKILGYREQIRDVEGVARHINIFSNDGFAYVHVGSTEAFQRYAIDLVSGGNTTIIDRSPAAFTADPDALWRSDTIFQVSGGTALIFAAPVSDLNDITSEADVPVYYGDVLDTAILVPAIDPTSGLPLETSGGLVAVGPYLFLYGHDGVIQWNAPGNPLERTAGGSGDSRPVSDKIIKGMPLRGNAAPAAIFWSLSSVIIGNFVGGATFWNFSTVTTSGSILSANGVIEHNGIYYWVSTSGFSQFAGVMQDLKNEYNKDYFFRNLNYSQRQKVFAYKVPKWNEIWWCFPFGNSTECNHAIIFNYVTGYWYDTPLPNDGRGAGHYDVTYSFPIMSGVTINNTGGTSMWQHETGLDEVSGAVATPKAIRASFTTNEFNLATEGDPRALAYSVLEPDFDQVGDLTLEVFSRANARSPVTSPVPDTGQPYPYVIAANPTQEEETISFRWNGRLTSFKVESNTLGGDFVCGVPLLHMKPSDSRRT